MAPRMAASVLRSLALFLFLFIFCAFGHSDHITFSRDELLNIRQSSHYSSYPFFTNPESFLEILVGGAAALCGSWRRRRRGTRAGALVKLRRRGFRTALPSIHLANLRSLPNKVDELLLLNRTNKDFARSAALCFTETWLSERVPDAVLNLPGFQLHRADCETELSGKTKGGGVCFYINVTVLQKYRSPNLATFFINCKPQFSSFILVGVYIPPQANANNALCKLADQITTQTTHHKLPKYREHIDCPTSDNVTLDYCYTTLKDAYHSVPPGSFGTF